MSTAHLGAVARRGHRLARGIQNLGFGERAVMVIDCCNRHALDRDVALAAAGDLELDARVLDSSDDLPSLSDMRTARHRLLVLVCKERLETWRLIDIPAVIISDGPVGVWWKALEARHAGCAGEVAARGAGP
jgi:hypothetical protein